MSSGWKERDGLTVRRFSRDETAVLTSLASGLDETLDSPDMRGVDAVLARLLPDAYDAEEEGASEEFAEHTASRIAEAKQGRLRALMADLDPTAEEAVTRHRTRPGGTVDVALDAEGAQRWALAVNDMRLGLAERLGVSQAGGGDSDRGPLGDVLDWLGWLQAGLLEVAMGVR